MKQCLYCRICNRNYLPYTRIAEAPRKLPPYWKLKQAGLSTVARSQLGVGRKIVQFNYHMWKKWNESSFSHYIEGESFQWSKGVSVWYCCIWVDAPSSRFCREWISSTRKDILSMQWYCQLNGGLTKMVLESVIFPGLALIEGKMIVALDDDFRGHSHNVVKEYV